MRKSITVTIIMVGLLAGRTRGQTTSGTIASDETWSGTVTITGDVVVQNAAVTIQPGTKVEFATTNDNVVNGDAEHIHLIFKDGSTVSAKGTESEPIVFTSASATPAPGMWGEVDIAGSLNVDSSGFDWCIFEYGNNAMDFRSGETSGEWSTIELLNPIVIQNTIIRHMKRSGVYITSGGEPDFINCVFHDINSAGVFAHGARTVDLKFCAIYDVSVGIICAGEQWWSRPPKVIGMNCVIYKVDSLKTDTPKWWTGFGIYCSNAVGTVYWYNGIIHTSTKEGVALNTWYFNKRNNCYYRTGPCPIEGGGDLHSKSIEADPLFVNPDSGDFSLQPGSPCIGAGYDGSNMGLWQDNPIRERLAASPRVLPLIVTAGPDRSVGFKLDGQTDNTPVTLNIYTVDGTMVRPIAGAVGRVLYWDGRDRWGKPMTGGIYVVRIRAGEAQAVRTFWLGF